MSGKLLWRYLLIKGLWNNPQTPDTIRLYSLNLHPCSSRCRLSYLGLFKMEEVTLRQAFSWTPWSPLQTVSIYTWIYFSFNNRCMWRMEISISGERWEELVVVPLCVCIVMIQVFIHWTFIIFSCWTGTKPNSQSESVDAALDCVS